MKWVQCLFIGVVFCCIAQCPALSLTRITFQHEFYVETIWFPSGARQTARRKFTPSPYFSTNITSKQFPLKKVKFKIDTRFLQSLPVHYIDYDFLQRKASSSYFYVITYIYLSSLMCKYFRGCVPFGDLVYPISILSVALIQ